MIMMNETTSNTRLSQSDKAFGKFKVHVAQALNPKIVDTLNSLYDLPREDKSRNKELACVESLVERGIITRSSVTTLVKDLEDVRYQEVAQKTSSLFEGYLQEKELESKAHQSSAVMVPSQQSLGNPSKRKLDSQLEACGQRKAKMSKTKKQYRRISRYGFNKECSIYVHKLFNFPCYVGSNKALLIGLVFDSEPQKSPHPKLLYTTTKTGEVTGDENIYYRLICGRKITGGSFYKLQNCYYIEDTNMEGILLTPSTHCSLLSRRKFGEIPVERPLGGPDAEYLDGVEEIMYLPRCSVARVKHQFPKGYSVFHLKGVVKEVDWRNSPPSPRIVLAVIDDKSGDSLSVVIPSEHASLIKMHDLVENTPVLLRYFETKGEGGTNYLISTYQSDIQVIQDDSLQHLVDFDESREGYVNEVDEVQFYLACPDCFHAKVDDTMRCRWCEETFRESDLERYFYVKIILELTDVDENSEDEEKTIDGVIFKDDLMKTIQTYDNNVNQPQTKEEVDELCEILIDKKVKLMIKSKGSRTNNVFVKLRILQP